MKWVGRTPAGLRSSYVSLNPCRPVGFHIFLFYFIAFEKKRNWYIRFSPISIYEYVSMPIYICVYLLAYSSCTFPQKKNRRETSAIWPPFSVRSRQFCVCLNDYCLQLDPASRAFACKHLWAQHCRDWLTESLVSMQIANSTMKIKLNLIEVIWSATMLSAEAASPALSSIHSPDRIIFFQIEWKSHFYEQFDRCGWFGAGIRRCLRVFNSICEFQAHLAHSK